MEFLNYFSNVFSLANILILILGTVGGLWMGVVDFRTKNIESFDSLERNAIDLYASVKSLYIQERNKKIANSQSLVGQDASDWEEIDTN